MGLKRTESQSSNVRTIEYEPETSKMTVEFRSGGRYEYAGVPEVAHDTFAGAQSHGKHFHAHIRGRYPTTKVA